MPRFDFGIFRSDLTPDESGLVGVGGELRVEILLEAYSKGIFPWTGRHPIPWFSPDPRLILEPGALKVSRSLEKRLRNGGFEVRFDTDFRGVMVSCATATRAGRPGTWITPNMVSAYGELHRKGFAHSVEVYVQGRLVGGLYGVAIGRVFFGESMFFSVNDASKVALVALCRVLERRDFEMIDCQQETPHLLSLGACALSRSAFMARLERAVDHPGFVGSWTDLDRAEVPSFSESASES
jgi:leucyl/phenylalanyl-tRNA---protein transferase